MRKLSLHLFIVFLALWSPFEAGVAQQGQLLRIVKGNKVTMRADAAHALSFIWLRDGEPIAGAHDARIVVTEPGIYTVIALGTICHSEASDPVEILIDTGEPDKQVDIEIQSLTEHNAVFVNEPFKHHLLLLNKGAVDASELVATFSLPQSLSYLEVVEPAGADVSYNSAANELSWRLARLAAGAAESLWLRLQGNAAGEAIVLARVRSAEQDRRSGNNESESKIDVINLFIPNVITPNGDGKNDRFVIRGIEFFGYSRLRIFNVDGQQLYDMQDYKNDWDADKIGEGTYFYYLELTDSKSQKHVFKGYITVLSEE